MDIGSARIGGGADEPRQSSRQSGMGAQHAGAARLARVLGWVSLGLGAAELLAPGAVSRAIGLDGASRGWLNGGTRRRDTALRAFGAREILTGIGILAARRPLGSLWARVAGDVLDLGALAFAGRQGAGTPRLAAAATAVTGIAALDVLCARQLSARRRPSRLVERDGTLRIVHAMAINKPPAECYAFWRRLDNLPRFMTRIESVTATDARRSHWVARGPANARLEWDAEITEDVPDQVIVWRAVEDSPVDMDGSVRFEPGPRGRGTLVRLSMRYAVPGGRIGGAVAQLVGAAPDALVREDLRRFKRLMETGTTPTTEGQPHGRRRGPIGAALAKLAEQPRAAMPARGRTAR